MTNLAFKNLNTDVYTGRVMPDESPDSRPEANRFEISLNSLIQPAITVSHETLVSEVKEMLKDHPPWSSVVVIRDKKPAGLVMRYHLDHQLGTQYGVSLFYRREISQLMDSKPLIFETDQLLGEAARAAMNREQSKIYDNIIITSDGQIAGTVSVQKMLDALAKAEIRARENAETATQAKTEFLANMSHDIRTPMNAILGMADLLWESPLNTDQKKYVSVFRNAGESLLDLINDILDLSKVESGQIELEETRFDLAEVVEKTCEIMALKAHEKDVELLCHIAPDVPYSLKGDPSRLRQIITNLVGNAVKFTERGEIELGVQRAYNFRKNGKVFLRFFVRDTGIGIPKDRQKNLFQPFTQAHSSTSREYGGTGLGLTICKKLSELMGGKIWIESQPGSGTSFHFIVGFPMDDIKLIPMPVCINLDKIRILIADRNKTGRENLGITLRHWGAEVYMAKTADECAEQIESAQVQGRPFQVIIADKALAEQGFESSPCLKDRFKLNKQIIMLIRSTDLVNNTGETGKMELCKLVKPVKQRELAAAICMTLGFSVPIKENIQKPKDLPSPVSPMHILLAEDNLNNQLLFSLYLENTGHTVEITANGKECIDKYVSGNFDIVFMDIDMPVMNGYKAAAFIRKWEKDNSKEPVPVIALTAHALTGKYQESLDAGCTDHITKPFKKDQLLEALHQYSKQPLKTNQCEKNPIAIINSELRELIPGFMKITNQEIKNLETAIQKQNFENIRRLGHSIKGSCLCYGFEAAGQIAGDIEIAGQKKDIIENIIPLADKLKNYINFVDIIFK
ncbi:Two component system response regulator/histidine kinase [Desulfonema limicola]|uniref:Sensory/regulatory protein RpfC n=1 Tax=Desulfonema limicola TaxID=45656 RepID=A0A975BEE0_9BACT|nr:ATP-binding protein [Desulfonema limicola]QTA83575.1 Two component system response regulator/histidine kinase [Desulfonema limicola]